MNNSQNANNSERLNKDQPLSSENRQDDLKDSPRDEERLQPDTANIDLPEVSDIPGQENIHVPPLGELADTTISSDDEEGRGLFDDDHEEGPVNNLNRKNNDDRR